MRNFRYIALVAALAVTGCMSTEKPVVSQHDMPTVPAVSTVDSCREPAADIAQTKSIDMCVGIELPGYSPLVFKPGIDLLAEPKHAMIYINQSPSLSLGMPSLKTRTFLRFSDVTSTSATAIVDVRQTVQTGVASPWLNDSQSVHYDGKPIVKDVQTPDGPVTIVYRFSWQP